MKKSLLTIILLFVLLKLISCMPGGNRDELWMYDPNQYERVVINYKSQGNADTTLLFIHGWNIDQTYWNDALNYFDKRYKVVTLDLAGHGESSKARTNWTAESFAKDIINIINKDSLKNIVIVGHALGGEVALQIYKNIPDKIIGVIGVESFKDVSFEITSNFTAEFSTYLDKFKVDYAEMADAFARENTRSDNRDVINRIVNDHKNADPKIALAIYKNMVPKYEEDKIILATIPFPLLIIASRYKPYNEEALSELTPAGYQIFWLDNTAHFPMLEDPQQFNMRLKDALSYLKQSSN